MATVRWQRDVPESIRSLGALERSDYEDVVTSAMQQPPGMTPEQLVRATLKGLPRGLVRVLPLVQRALLGLRLELRPSPDHVLGWKIAERGETWIRIEAASWLLTAHVVMHAADDCLFFATFVRYERLPAALVWPPVSLIHRQVALALVRSARKTRQPREEWLGARSG